MLALPNRGRELCMPTVAPEQHHVLSTTCTCMCVYMPNVCGAQFLQLESQRQKLCLAKFGTICSMHNGSVFINNEII